MLERFAFGALFFPLLAAAAPAQQAVSPADRADIEGSSYTHYPLGRHSARVQTLHDLPTGAATLAAHGYRRDAIGVRGVVPGFACELEVRLSMSPRTAATASATFSDNVGPQEVVVLPRQVVTFPATDRPPLDPAATYELVVPYATPFSVPQQGGTLCVDVRVFSNQTPTGPNQNLSVYLDAHQQYPDGRARQRAFRTGIGCPAPGSQTNSYADLDLWRLPAGTTELDVSIRHGVPDPGTGTTRAFLTIGTAIAGAPWPTRSDCPFWSSAEVWFALPGPLTGTGRYDGRLTNLPLLPPGFRLWCQAGSIDLATAGLAFSDALTMTTPPFGQVPIPAARIANGSDVHAAAGVVSASVPVTAFF